MSRKRIVVVGAGVSGLTTALLLSKRGEFTVTVAAKHMPGDYDIEYASPWAGANYMPHRWSVSKGDTRAAEHERDTWPFLEELARTRPEAGVHFQRTMISNRTKDVNSATAVAFSGLLSPDPWWKTIVPDFRAIPSSELKSGIDSATEFTSVCINTAIYLPWLISECLKKGVHFKRAVFKHIVDAAASGVHHSGQSAELVVNCTGLSAAKLGGVNDNALIPARGQIVVVRNDAGAMYSVSGTDDGDDEAMYIMTRAAGGGTVLGGCYQKGNWESQPDPNLAVRIMKRCLEACPQLGRRIEDLDVVRHSVGLRPVREGGVRLERENIDGVTVVHNYGHGGYGYQSSFGCSLEAIRLVDKALNVSAKL